jgi:hypothetical protein
MASTKSTVVGIRLDHERRAWVEAEAARLGLSVRGLFEGMIDEARTGEKAEADRAIAGLGSAAIAQEPTESAEAIHAVEAPEQSSTSEPLSGVNAPPTSPWPSVGSVTGVPGGLIREAFSLTTSLIELGGRCATKRLSSCVLTRHLTNRSL